MENNAAANREVNMNGPSWKAIQAELLRQESKMQSYVYTHSFVLYSVGVYINKVKKKKINKVYSTHMEISRRISQEL